MKVLEGEARIAGEYGLRYNFDKMVVYPLAGNRFVGDLSGFRRLGITVDFSCNVKFMQVPIVGDSTFLEEWAGQKMDIIRGVLEGIKGLSKRQVALYLLRGAGHGCRIVY